MDLDLENSLALKGLEVHEEVEDSHEQENERNYIFFPLKICLQITKFIISKKYVKIIEYLHKMLESSG